MDPSGNSSQTIKFKHFEPETPASLVQSIARAVFYQTKLQARMKIK